jgi:methionyl-tRNA formyltransferase
MSSSSPPARVLLIGFGPTTRAALDSLLGSFHVLALVRDSDDEVAEHARRRSVPVEILRSRAEISDVVARTRPDCVVVSSYNRILSGPVLDLCPFVNVHYSPLPEYRGRANVNWAIINHELRAAVTVHSIAAGLDAGGVLAQAFVPIGPRDTIRTVYDRLNAVQGEILPPAVRRRLTGDLGAPQDESGATYCCTRLPEDGEVDWSASTRDIDALVRAVGFPYPEAFTFLGLDRVSIIEAEPSSDGKRFVGRIPGRVVGWSTAEGWSDVLTGDGVLRVKRVRLGDVEHPASHVFASSRLTLGLRSLDLLGRIESLEARIAELTGAATESGTDVGSAR